MNKCWYQGCLIWFWLKTGVNLEKYILSKSSGSYHLVWQAAGKTSFRILKVSFFPAFSDQVAASPAACFSRISDRALGNLGAAWTRSPFSHVLQITAEQCAEFTQAHYPAIGEYRGHKPVYVISSNVYVHVKIASAQGLSAPDCPHDAQENLRHPSFITPLSHSHVHCCGCSSS